MYTEWHVIVVIGSRHPHWQKGLNGSNQEERRIDLYLVTADVVLVSHSLGEVAGRLWDDWRMDVNCLRLLLPAKHYR